MEEVTAPGLDDIYIYISFTTLPTLSRRDAEWLRLYVESELYARENLDASLKKAQLTIQCLELEAKKVADREAREETERDAVRQEMAMVRLEIEAAGSARVHVELERPRSKML